MNNLENVINALKETITKENIEEMINYADKIKSPLLKELYIDNLQMANIMLKKTIKNIKGD